MGPQENNQEQGSRVPGLLAGGAVAGSPFLGLIGQKPIKYDPYHDPKVRRVTLGELDRIAKPGDIILTNKRKGTGWKTIQMPQESEFYHAQPIITRHQGQGITTSANELYAPEFQNMSSRKLVKDYLRGIKDTARQSHYSDLVLLRPNTPLTPEQQKAFMEESIARAKVPYGKKRAITNWLRDIFLPKIGGGKSKIPAGYTCTSDVCSTLPSHAYSKATGKTPFEGKLPGNIMPADLLREGSAYRPVAAHLSYGGLTPQQLRTRGLLSRGALGLGLGAATYAGVEDPTTIPVLPAFALAPTAGAAIMKQIKARQMMQRYKNVSPALRAKILERAEIQADKAMPGFLEIINSAKDPSREAAIYRRNILRRSLPVGLASAAGVYGLMQLLKNRFSSPESEQKPA